MFKTDCFCDFIKNCYKICNKTNIILLSALFILTFFRPESCLAQDEIKTTGIHENVTKQGSFAKKNFYKAISDPKDHSIEVKPNTAYNFKGSSRVEAAGNYDPYALADFFDVAESPVSDGLLVGYDNCGLPLIVTERELDTLSNDELIDKISRDPQFHEFREGYSLKRIKTTFPDFKLPTGVLERNKLPTPGQFVWAFQVFDEKQRAVYKRNGEKAVYFLRSLPLDELVAIQKAERDEEEWDMKEEELNQELVEDQDEMEIYEGRAKALAASEILAPKSDGRSIIKAPMDLHQQINIRDRVQNGMSYTQFWILVGEGRIEKVRFSPERQTLIVTTKQNAPGGARLFKVGMPFDPHLSDHLLLHGVYVEDTELHVGTQLIFHVILIVFPVAVILYFQKLLYNFGNQKKSSEAVFAQARLEKYQGVQQIGVTFDDLAGADTVKDEMQEIIAFLRSPKKYLNMGCRTPSGVLLAGPPGTGKTLLAKAVAGEACVPFFSASGTEFAEVYSGVGASRVRDMFETARKNSPCILFIDEFDSIGKARKAAYSGGGNENVATINQLLTELDGFENNDGILVMAATNRPSVLDEALTRPGRFDRVVTMGLPTTLGRASIFQVHCEKKKVDNKIDWVLIARATTGFSGADIMNVMNVAATLSVKAQEHFVSQDRIFDAIEKTISEKNTWGIPSRCDDGDDELIPASIKRQVAVYTAGKSIIAYMTPFFDEVVKIECCSSSQPRGQVFLVAQDDELQLNETSRCYLESKIVVLLAGQMAEKLVFGHEGESRLREADHTAAEAVAEDIVFKHGLGRRLGPVNLTTSGSDYLRSDDRIELSENIDPIMIQLGLADIANLLASARAKAYFGLVSNYSSLKKVSSHLFFNSSMGQREFEKVLEHNGVKSFPSPLLTHSNFGYESIHKSSLSDSEGYVIQALKRIKKNYLVDQRFKSTKK
eukprot:gnl/MRDRNA2_/MRDRNA2_86312_c0_seq1.p1 gnl/MRDRNA2_/MRDRNA2_86312_c0~~gnl/MRDRNA2_/MRDRNA2_86312_c0_seq1.p1  ORF type:complete len:944 (+),score=74.05 gnl/MRDRNA2_/MRDRNA2_86312_c0_seq1:51-2882(+)